MVVSLEGGGDLYITLLAGSRILKRSIPSCSVASKITGGEALPFPPSRNEAARNVWVHLTLTHQSSDR